MKAIYAGSFDPFTNGHLHVIKQAVELFDKLYIVVAKNSNKERFTNTIGTLLNIMDIIISEKIMGKCIVVSYEGLIYEFAKHHKVEYLIRGLRNGTDFEYEENIAKINEEQAGLKTIYIRAGNMGYISSSAVREIYNYGGDISKFVHPKTIEMIKGRNINAKSRPY